MKESAEKYIKYGFNCIPVNADKTPACDWKHFQKNMISELKLFTSEAIGVVCGKVSDNLEVLDFDNHGGTAKENLKKYIENPLIKTIYDKYKLPIIQTQGNGYHIYYRCDKIEGNQKLAMVKLNGKPDAIIETRGEGGYVLAPPSKGYKLIRNDWADLQHIEINERVILLEVAKSFNEHSKSVKQFKSTANDEKPGNIYNNLPESIEEAKNILKSIGWVELGFNNAWRRPGKNRGISATFGNIAPNVFYSFSSNVEYFDFETVYTPFQIKALVEFNGDFNECAKELALKYNLNRKEKQPEKSDKKKELKSLLLKTYIDLSKPIKTPPTILSIRNQFDFQEIRVMTLGNISVIKGKAKSKKTFVNSIIASSLASGAELFHNIVPSLPKNKEQVVIFDTEQSEYDSWNVAYRIDKLGKGIDNFGMHSLRGLDKKSIIELIEFAVYEIYKKIGIIFIDQSADLVASLNDEAEAVEVVKWMEKLSNEKQIHISTILHENKQNNFAQGWLGTQLMKKSETIIEVEKEPSNKRVSHVSPYDTRGKEFEGFSFMINNDGMPELLTNEDRNELLSEDI